MLSRNSTAQGQSSFDFITHQIRDRFTARQVDEEMRLCKCGCGRQLNLKVGRKNKNFVKGHGFVNNPNLEPSKELSYVIGVIDGDGFISKAKNGNYRIGLNVTKKEFIEKFCKFLAKILNKDKPIPFFFDNNTGKNGCFRCLTYSRKLYYFLKKDSVESIIKKYPLSYIKGVFDSDGCISHTNKKTTIRIFNTDKKILNKVQKALNLLKIKNTIHTNRRGYFSIWIRRPSVNNFLKLTGGKYG